MLLVEKEHKIKFMLEDVDEFLDCNDFSQATNNTYAYHLKRFADWIGDCGLIVECLTGQLLKTYLNSQKWKPNTQRAAGNAAKTFLRWKYGKDHPALRLKLPRDDAAPGRSLEQSQLDRLLASFDTTKAAGWRDLSIIALISETGLREAEICMLELGHLNLEGHRLNAYVKGRKWRPCVFSDITACYLDIWIGARGKYAVSKCPYVFVSVNGKTKGRHLTPGGMRANFRKMGIKSEIGKLSPHDLRRTMATLLIENGAPTRLVQILGGWEDIRMVERYTRNLKAESIEEFSPVVKSMRLVK
jgi:site-specific recombinase XerD